jgi:TetR/AcrR family transcriptional regulator, transcriptional repressor for nem operon
MVSNPKAAEETRMRIMQTAFSEFYRRGFQGASLNRIVEEASTTKGALFHHFSGKSDLGHAVVDELLYPEVKAIWIDPLQKTDQPIETIAFILNKLVSDCSNDRLCQGCPLNNLAQEMSPLDEDFRLRLERIYSEWREAIEGAFMRGIEAGGIKKTAEPRRIAVFMVACFSGTIGTAKNAQDPEIFELSGGALMEYLETQRA